MRFYLRMAWHSLKQRRGLTAVMIAALSLGIGTWYVQGQIFTFLDAKAPATRDDLFHIALERGEPAPAGRPSIVTPLVPSILLTPRDAEGVLAGAPRGRVLTFNTRGLVEADGKPAESVQIRYATRDLFELFDIPLVAGAPWPAAADAGLFAGTPGDEAVIDERLAVRHFGDAPAIGRTLRVDGADVRIVGVVAARHDGPFHLYERLVRGIDMVYLPLSHAGPARAQPNFSYVVAGGETGYVNAWVQLATATERAAFVASAERYLASERARGRTATPRAVTVRPAEEWKAVFAPGGAINLWPLLSGLCVATAIINLIRMLMAKFAGRSHDLGLLRALGARRRDIIGQLLLEAVLIGLLAGAGAVLIGVATMPLAASTIGGSQGAPATISATAVLATLGASIGAAVLAALYPVWRLSRGTPAVQMRTR